METSLRCPPWLDYAPTVKGSQRRYWRQLLSDRMFGRNVCDPHQIRDGHDHPPGGWLVTHIAAYLACEAVSIAEAGRTGVASPAIAFVAGASQSVAASLHSEPSGARPFPMILLAMVVSLSGVVTPSTGLMSSARAEATPSANESKAHVTICDFMGSTPPHRNVNSITTTNRCLSTELRPHHPLSTDRRKRIIRGYRLNLQAVLVRRGIVQRSCRKMPEMVSDRVDFVQRSP